MYIRMMRETFVSSACVLLLFSRGSSAAYNGVSNIASLVPSSMATSTSGLRTPWSFLYSAPSSISASMLLDPLLPSSCSTRDNTQLARRCKTVEQPLSSSPTIVSASAAAPLGSAAFRRLRRMGVAILRHASEQLSVCTRSWARSRSRRRARVLRTAALEARRVPAEPSARQQLRRQAVIFGLARCEVEEALSFAVDCVFAGLSGGNFSLLEQKAARLYNHHNQRWPMITWLMGLATPTMARPLISLLSPQQRMEARGRQLKRALSRLAPALCDKVGAAVKRDARLVLPLSLRLLAASSLAIAWQAAIALKLRPARAYALLNACLDQVHDLLLLARLPADERLVDLDAVYSLLYPHALPAHRSQQHAHHSQLKQHTHRAHRAHGPRHSQATAHTRRHRSAYPSHNLHDSKHTKYPNSNAEHTLNALTSAQQ